MVDFSYLQGNAPQAASYKAPDLAGQLYAMVGNLPNDAFQAQQQARTTALQQPVQGQNGQPPGINDILAAAVQRGGLQEAIQLLPTLQKQPFFNQLLQEGQGGGGGGGDVQPPAPQQDRPTAPNGQPPAAFHAANERQAANDQSRPVGQGDITRLADDNERQPGDEMKARRVAAESVRKQVERPDDEKIAPGDRFGGAAKLVPQGVSDPLTYAAALEKRAEAMRKQSALKSAVGISTKADEDQAAAYDKKAAEIREQLGKTGEKTVEQKNVESGVTQQAGQIAADTKHYAALHEGLTGTAHIAAQQAQNIDMLQQVANAKAFTPGAGNRLFLDVQRLAAQFGFNTKDAAPMEIFHQVAAKVLADQFSGMRTLAEETGSTGSRVFKSMLDIEEKANITKEDTLEGVKAKLEVAKRMGELSMKWGDLADDYKLKHGKLDAGFDKELRSQMAKARIPNIVPGAESGPPSGYVHDGLRFNGGDYRDQKNWSPVRPADRT
jgi:hypothetical protein